MGTQTLKDLPIFSEKMTFLGRKTHTRAKSTTVDGIRFRSKAEAGAYLKLKAFENAGLIKELAYEKRYPLTLAGVRIGLGYYTADFSFTDVSIIQKDALCIVEVKGRKFREWPMRRDLIRAIYQGHIFIVSERGKETHYHKGQVYKNGYGEKQLLLL